MNAYWKGGLVAFILYVVSTCGIKSRDVALLNGRRGGNVASRLNLANDRKLSSGCTVQCRFSISHALWHIWPKPSRGCGCEIPPQYQHQYSLLGDTEYFPLLNYPAFIKRMIGCDAMRFYSSGNQMNLKVISHKHSISENKIINVQRSYIGVGNTLDFCCVFRIAVIIYVRFLFPIGKELLFQMDIP